MNGFVRSIVRRQSGSSPSVCSTARASGRSVWRHSSTIAPLLPAGSNSVVSTPSDTMLYAPGNARPRRRRRFPTPRAARRSSPSSRSRCARPGGYAEALRREERRDGETLGVAQREVRQARQPGLEAVHDVEPSESQRARQVRSHADRHADAAAARDRHRRAEDDEPVVVERSVVERDASRGQVGCAVRRRDDRDSVAERAQFSRDAGDVLVHVVRLRPGERSDEADPERHRAPSLALYSSRTISRWRTAAAAAELAQRFGRRDRPAGRLSTLTAPKPRRARSRFSRAAAGDLQQLHDCPWRGTRRLRRRSRGRAGRRGSASVAVGALPRLACRRSSRTRACASAAGTSLADAEPLLGGRSTPRARV